MAYNPNNVNGQATAASSAPVVIASNQIPLAAALADATSNPTTATMSSDSMVFNGTTWDRLRGNTTSIAIADTGVKTASFSGATQTNYNNVGAYIWILCGTVSGTTPTLVTVLQWSPDDGTTFYDITSATTAVTATNASIGYQVYPGVNATWNVSTTASKVLISALPRTWRIRYVIGGTTPSFNISDVRVNYIK